MKREDKKAPPVPGVKVPLMTARESRAAVELMERQATLAREQADHLARRESFRDRFQALLVELTVAARGLGAAEPAKVALRAIRQLLEDER